VLPVTLLSPCTDTVVEASSAIPHFNRAVDVLDSLAEDTRPDDRMVMCRKEAPQARNLPSPLSADLVIRALDELDDGPRHSTKATIACWEVGILARVLSTGKRLA
jgi:hypothetical protein